MLETFGVDTAAERTYRAMVDHPDWDVAGLAMRLGLPDRDALDMLVACTLVRPSVEMPGRLGMSPRTARRMMPSLMERLDARSSFETGL